MIKATLIAVGMAVLALTYVWTSRSKESGNIALTHDGGIRNAPAVNIAERRALITRAPRSSSKHLPASAIYKKLLADSRDYWEFAQRVLPAAQAGDPDAQFYLSKALSFCTQANDNYFHLDGRSLTPDEWLQYAAKLRLPIDFAQSVYDRCHAFQDHDAAILGNATDWLEQATENGQPAAQATTATDMLQQQYERNFLKAGAAPTPDNTAPLIGNGASPTELIQAAVQSGDPEALLNIGWAQALLNPGKDANTQDLAWTLVACERGLDCSENADWVRISCRHCDASSPVNLVRSQAGDDWPAVQQLAEDINAKMDRGQWDQLGLGAGT